jgi:hypothetical protein
MNEAREILKALVETAIEAGQRERERLGRDLTEAEAAELAALVQRQARIALTVVRAGGRS